MDRVNVFNPFESKSDQAEDRLTWAFLVALRYDPFLQNFLRERVEAQLPSKHRTDCNTWEPARIVTQTKWIESSTSYYVSVLLSDAPMKEEIRVGWSDREPRYDGVIEYPNRMTLILENKLHHGNVWEAQLSPSRNSLPNDILDDVTLHDLAICLEWSEILEGVLMYADSSLAPFGSREIARDFLSFVEARHPELTPYRTFRLCGNRAEALDRRIVRLIGDIASQTELDSGTWGLYRPDGIAAFVGIWRAETEPWKLQVGLWPATTAEQADRFGEVVDKERFLSLSEQGWEVVPHLRFSFMGTQRFRHKTAWETRRYLEFFFRSDRPYGRKRRRELSPLAEEWQGEGLIDLETREEIERQRQAKQPFLDVTPQFEVYRDWDRDAVIKLEEQGNLEEAIIQALASPLATWGEEL